MFNKNLLLVLLTIVAVACKSVDKKDQKNNESTNDTTDKTDKTTTGYRNSQSAEIFAQSTKDAEVFRVVVSSNGYDKKQLSNFDEISVKDDPAGDSFLTQELEKYDKINFRTDAVLKLELFPDSGLISRVRFKKPSQITELDKLLSEDVTRWVFEFKNKTVSPRIFHISYTVLLQKKISREEALKILQEKVK